MWILTTSGFLSVVKYEHGRDANALPLPLPPGARATDLLLVRARVSSDLSALLTAIDAPASRATSTPSADYPHRAVLTKHELQTFLSQEIDRISYPNFKNTIRDPRRHTAYMKVWSALRDLHEPRSEQGSLV